jgi:hypothetical protein
MKRIFDCLVITAVLLVKETLVVGAPPGTGSQSMSDQAVATMLAGMWELSWPSHTRIELRTDGTYEWWTPYLQSDLAAKTVIQTGKWQVRERALCLSIDKALPRDVPPGTAFTYDIVSVSSNNALLNSRDEKREVKWTRASQQTEPFWKRAVSYQAPFKMRSRLHPATIGALTGDWELYSWGEDAGTNAHAQIVFHLGTAAEFIGTDKTAKALETAADLKSFVDSNAGPDPGGRVLTSIIRIDGREALMSLSRRNRVHGGKTEWRCAACFFWKVHPVWQDSTICSITMTAETRETLSLLTNSLRTVKLVAEE